MSSNVKPMVLLILLTLNLMNFILKPSKTNGFEGVSQVESHEFQCKTNGSLKVFHTESHEFHSKTNGIAQIFIWNLMNSIVKPIIESRFLMLNLINSNQEPTCFRHLPY